MVGLGQLPGGSLSFARAVSAGGTTIVGEGVNARGNYEAFAWRQSTGMVGLGFLPGASIPDSIASSVSADGSTVVGSSACITPAGIQNPQAFVWTAAAGMRGLGYLPGASNPHSYAQGISADGSTVVGAGGGAQGDREAFVLDLTPDPAKLILALIEQVKGLNLPHGIENSLVSKLDAALQEVNKKNNTAAVNVLNAFINHVRAQRGKAIPAAGADALVASATKIIELLQK